MVIRSVSSSKLAFTITKITVCQKMNYKASIVGLTISILSSFI